MWVNKGAWVCSVCWLKNAKSAAERFLFALSILVNQSHEICSQNYNSLNIDSSLEKKHTREWREWRDKWGVGRKGREGKGREGKGKERKRRRGTMQGWALTRRASGKCGGRHGHGTRSKKYRYISCSWRAGPWQAEGPEEGEAEEERREVVRQGELPWTVQCVEVGRERWDLGKRDRREERKKTSREAGRSNCRDRIE